MNEEWKPIKGYEGLYEVSNLGRVKSLGRKFSPSTKYFPNGATKKEKIISGMKGPNHYPQVSLFGKDHKVQYASVHRLVAEAFIPNPENKSCVNHIDGNKTNNVVSNLEWVTPSENILHSFDTGLNKSYGERNVNAKITKEQAEEIRNKCVKGSREYGYRSLAREYGISKTAIIAIVEGRTWRR